MGIFSVNRVLDTSLDRYDTVDTSLIPSKPFTRNFGDVDDYIETHVYTKDGRLLRSIYNTKEYELPLEKDNTSEQTTVTSIIYDAGKHLQDLGYSVGDYKVEYRAYRKKLFTLAEKTFFISEISSDRKEVRLATNLVSNNTLEENTLNFLHEIQVSPYYKEFLLNFGDNKVVNAVNIALDKNTSPYSVLIKLYQPLPTEFNLKSALWVVEELSEPVVFEVVLIPDVTKEPVEYIKPANFNIELDVHQSQDSAYENLDSIYATSEQSSYQKILNRLKDKSVKLNVDYTDYANFIHFSSAKERLSNFVYKLGLIESYNADIQTLSSVTNYSSSVDVNASIEKLKSNVDGIVQKMDGYETFLYTSNSTYAWPKSGDTLYAIDSQEAQDWYGDGQTYGQLATAIDYDTTNQDNLVQIIPGYIAQDDKNEPFLLFVSMLGQHYDTIWLYIKALNDIHKSTNSLDNGISKDLVYTALRSLGIKLYNNNGDESLYDYFLGAPSGSYDINAIEENISGEDRTKELYKRIYHNLPYLLKSKGTTRGIKALISTFGIPDTILDVTQYGGIDESSDTREYVYNRFNYSLTVNSGSYATLPWKPLTQSVTKYNKPQVPDTVEFRFKPDIQNRNDKTVLLQGYRTGSSGLTDFMAVTLEYTSSLGVPCANIKLGIRDFVNTSSVQYTTPITAPIYNPDINNEAAWWNLSVTRVNKQSTSSLDAQQFELRLNSRVDGVIDYSYSSSISTTVSSSLDRSWMNYAPLSSSLSIGKPVVTSSLTNSGSYFNGQIQEFRYWSEPLSRKAFDNHTLNPQSYEGNSVSGSYEDLAARFPLGNNLSVYNHNLTSSLTTVHPNYTQNTFSGSQAIMQFVNFPNKLSYASQFEYNYTNSSNSGYYSPVTDKIRIVDNEVDGDVIVGGVDLQKPDVYRTKDTHFLDVSLSLQTEVDKDIMAQYGASFNVDDYIGDPNYNQSGSYKDLENLKASYYKKYKTKNSYKDFTNLIKTFDNTLFKMIEDFTPARANLSTGFTVKSPIIERNKVKVTKAKVEKEQDKDATVTVTTFSTETNSSIPGYDKESITGEFSGSVIEVYDHIEEKSKNPYALYSQSADLNIFNHSDFNSTYGDVDKNTKSQYRYHLDEYKSTISSSAELQDFYYNSERYARPNYKGCKVSSTTYNFYTEGDTGSYGKTAAIDKNVGKLGWVKSIPSQSLNFFDKTQINLKYLVDSELNLTELNNSNKNLYEVQNTFKSGETLTVSLENISNPSNQKRLDGVKPIWKGGFSYDPVLYREDNEVLNFTFDDPIYTYNNYFGVRAHDNNSYSYTQVDGGNGIDPPDQPRYYAWYVNQTSQNVNGVNSKPMSYKRWGGGGTYPEWKYKNSSNNAINLSSGTSYSGANLSTPVVFGFNLLNFNVVDNNTESDGVYAESYNGNVLYKAPRSGNYKVEGNIPIAFVSLNDNYDGKFGGGRTFKVFALLEKCADGVPMDDENNWVIASENSYTVIDIKSVTRRDTLDWYSNYNQFYYDNTNGFNVNCTMRPTNVQVVAGDTLRFQLYIVDLSNMFGWDLSPGRLATQAAYFSINSGTSGYDSTEVLTSAERAYIQIQDISTVSQVGVTSLEYSQYPQIFTVDGDTMKFSHTLQSFIDYSIFNPTGSTSTKYTNVLDNFSVRPYDLIRLGKFNSKSSKYYTVRSVYNNAAPPIVIQGYFYYRLDADQTRYQYFTYLISDYGDPSLYFKSGNLVTFSNSMTSGTFTVTTVRSSKGYAYIDFVSNFIGRVPTLDTTFTFTRTEVKVDRVIDIDSVYASQNFAILRSKPDETSVILDYTKKEGETSTALLIPKYANTELIKSQADIFTNINSKINTQTP